jgi:hypothetical protein
MDFKVGQRIVVTTHITDGQRQQHYGELYLDIKGKKGTLFQYEGGLVGEWKVKIDNDLRFDSQHGCWHISEDEMDIIEDIKTNDDATYLLEGD